MNLSIRLMSSFVFLAGTAFAQNLTEFGAVAAGSTIGVAGGKPVSNGISAIFGKVDRTTATAAKDSNKDKDAVSLKIAQPLTATDLGGVPLPPNDPRKRVGSPSLPLAQMTVPEEARQILSLTDVAPNLPPPPAMSAEDLRTVANGTSRADVLKFGAPAGKITMYEDGHLLEVYSYRENGQKLGTLRLTDGAVSSIQ